MEYVILGLIVMAMLHFIYEGILAPSYRVEYGYQVFKLRDALRLLKIKRSRAFPDRAFHILQDSMNGIVRNMEGIDVMMLVECRVKIQRDKEFRARIDERVKVLENCPTPEVRDLRARSARMVERILSVNNGAWMFYVVPVAVAWLCYEKTARLIKCVAALSEPDIEKMAHVKPAPPMKLAA